MLTREQRDTRLDEISRLIASLPKNENSDLYIDQLKRISRVLEKISTREVEYGNTV